MVKNILDMEVRRMMYRDHKEYNKPPERQDNEILRSWLRGESGIDSLKTWLASISNSYA